MLGLLLILSIFNVLFYAAAIQLEKSFSVSIQEHPIFPEKYPHTFSLNTASRNYYVNADSEEMLNKWHTQIAEAIRQADKVSV